MINYIKNLWRNRLIIEKVDADTFKTKRGGSNYTFYSVATLYTEKDRTKTDLAFYKSQLKTIKKHLSYARRAK